MISQVCWLGYGMLTSNLVVTAHAPLGAVANLTVGCYERRTSRSIVKSLAVSR